VEIEEVNEEGIGAERWPVSGPVVIAAPDESQTVETAGSAVAQNSNGTGSMPLWAWIAIAGGAVLIVVVILLVVKRKK
jgi:hypothetical protein